MSPNERIAGEESDAVVRRAREVLRAAAREIAGPGASTQEFEDVLMAVREVVMERLLGEARARGVVDGQAAVPLARTRKREKRAKHG